MAVRVGYGMVNLVRLNDPAAARNASCSEGLDHSELSDAPVQWKEATRAGAFRDPRSNAAPGPIPLLPGRY